MPVWRPPGVEHPGTYAKAKAENRLNELPANHNPRFLPVIHPTLQPRVEALTRIHPPFAFYEQPAGHGQ